MLTSFTSYGREALIFLLSATFLILAFIRGIRSSIFADIMKIMFIVIIVLVIVPMSILGSGGLQTIIDGIGGKTGNFTDILDLGVFLTFGISISISLLSAAVIDQQLWQRAFSIKKGREKIAFYFGAAIFFFIPVLLSSLGFIGAANRLSPVNDQLIGYEVISNTLPFIGVALFVFTIILTMIAAGSSALCAASSIMCTDIYKTYMNKSASEEQCLKIGRYSMLVLLVIATAISLIPNIQIIYLVLLIGSIRGVLLIPTYFAIFRKKLSSTGVFYGILIGLLVGFPVFLYGSLVNQPIISSIGSLLTLIISFSMIVLFNRLRPEYFNFKHINKK